MHGSLLIYLAVVTTMIVVPGPDMALVVRAATIGGFRTAFRVIQGILGGVMIHASLAVLGIGTLVASTPLAMDVLRIVGAGWLAWIGGTALVSLRTASADAAAAQPTPSRRTGFLTNLLNAKVLLFYITLLPQFAPAGPRFTEVASMLAAIEIVLAFIWLAACALLVSHLSELLAYGTRARTALDLGTGCILVLAAVDLTWITVAHN